MKFSAPKTLIGAASPMLVINWIFGIGVIEYPIGRPRRVISVFWSIGNFLIYLSFMKLAGYMDVMKTNGSKIVASNYRTNAYFFATFIASSMYIGQSNAKVVKATFPKLNSINDRLHMLGIPNDHDLLFKTQINQLGIAFALIFVLMALDFKYIGRDFPSESSRIGFIMVSHYLLLFAFVVDYTFSTGVRYIGNRFRRLNALLADSDLSDEGGTMFGQESDNPFPCYSSVICDIYKNNLRAAKAVDRLWLLHVIKESRRIHRGLCKTAMEFNRAFGFQILFSVILSFVMQIIVLYSSYNITVASLPNKPIFEVWILEIIAIMWVVFYVAKILLIVAACESTSCEANRTGIVLSTIPDEKVCDEDIRNEIDIFSLQLIQNPLNFTAHGFFTLNYSLIRSMIGSVTTYLVIMIQMQTIYDPENVNSISNSTMRVKASDSV